MPFINSSLTCFSLYSDVPGSLSSLSASKQELLCKKTEHKCPYKVDFDYYSTVIEMPSRD